MVTKGWDPPLAYMQLLIELNKERRTQHLFTPQHLAQVGSEMGFYKGVPEFFDELQQLVHEDELMVRAGVGVARDMLWTS